MKLTPQRKKYCNELIAEFVFKEGYTEGKQTGYWNGVQYVKNDELKFHRSWDYLMLAVNEIERIENSIYQRDFDSIHSELIHISFNEGMGFGMGDSHFEALFNAVVDYIEQFNKQNRD